MVKVNNKKRVFSDKVNTKKDVGKNPGVNPFEVHINKQKHQIFGQKLKNDRGLPGVSRAKALKKRKHTLLQEYNVHNKSNKFVDKRIGERNGSMTAEDRQMARFTAERMKSHNKKSIYNLADEEVLTHRGQTLSEIEKFDDPRSDDDDEDFDGKNSGKLDDSFVEDAHFGGGILKKSGVDGAKSHKDLIDQLIAESKKRKAEKQKIREQTIELTEKLDTEWKDLLPLVNKSKRDDSTADAKNVDPYDKVMRELRFEARGQPSDRLKSEEEIAKEEKEKLEKLEQDRLNRMKGIVEEVDPKSKHRSADDLDDNFVYDSDPETTLAYNEDGTCLLKPEEPKKDDASDAASEVEASVEGSGSEEEDSDEDGSDDDLSDLKQDESESSDEEVIKPQIKAKVTTPEKVKESKKRKIDEDDEASVSNTPKKKNVQTVTDIKTPKEKLIEDIIKTPERNIEMNGNVKIKTPKNKLVIEDEKTVKKVVETESTDLNKQLNDESKKSQETEKVEEENKNSFIEELLLNEKKKEAASKELPYTYTMPESYEELQTLLLNQSPEYQTIIIERIIKCNHPNLGSGNKEALGRLFAYLLQHLNDVSSDPTKCFAVLNSLMPHLFDLAQMNKQNAHSAFIEVMKEKHSDFQKNVKKYPGVDVLMFLKVISCLFPTSDFRHQVVTPTMVFMCQMLTTCRIKTRYDISYGLFLVTMFLEYTALSKRLVPAVINYLAGLLHMAIPKTGVQLIKVIPPFKPTNTSLVLPHKVKKTDKDLRMSNEDFTNDEIDDSFKVKTMYNAVKILEEFYDNYSVLPSCGELFLPLLNFMEKIPSSHYPKEVKTVLENVKEKIDTGIKNMKIEYLVRAAKKPKALRLYEPNIVKIVEGKNHKFMSKEKAEKSKLLHKYKKEMKGALREIRRDKSFLGTVKLKQKIDSDRERKEKVKRIFSEASIQQSELNALSRKKKSK